MSVTVGFSPATTSLIAPAAGATTPDGAPADGSTTEAGGVASLFAALLSMLTPGAEATPETETAAKGAPVVAPPVGQPPVAFTTPETAEQPAPVLPDLEQLQQSPDGKALLKDLTDALKAAKAALDEGKPLEPALAKKLKTAVDAVAAWFAGQPQLQAPTIDTTKLSELAAATDILPAAPSSDLPLAVPGDTPDGEADATPNTATPSTVGDAELAPKTMEARPVPTALADFSKALKEFASTLEAVEPSLAASLSALADRASVGDVSDDALAQLGLTRTATATSPELEQLVAAVATPPSSKPSAAAPQSPIAPPVLDLPETLAETAPTTAAQPATTKPEPAKTKTEDVPAAKVDSARAAASTASTEPTDDTSDPELDTTVKLEAGTTRHADTSSADNDPVAPPAHASAKSADANPAAVPADSAAQVAQAAATTAATATRAIHAAYAAPVQQVNLPQVAFEVARQFEAGNTKFQIRLDPQDLGRIDVSLDLDKHGTVNARMFVERPETLDLMMRDQRALQQALQQAGLDTSKTNLEFSLRQNPFAGGGDMGQNGGNSGERGFGPFGTPATDDVAELPAQTLYRGSASASGVNLFV